MELQKEYCYPYAEEAGLPVKISVSELKRQANRKAAQMEEESEAETFLQEQESISGKEEPEIPKPAFLMGETALSGTAKGTLYHLVMEHFPYQQIRESGQEWGEKEFSDYLCTLEERGYLSGQEREALDCKRFVRFIRSGVGKRMAAAAAEKRLRLEQPFMLGLPADQIYAEQTAKTTIVVQGIIDAFFFENDGEEEKLVLVDYKTDFVKYGEEESLKEKYRAQLDYYARALERLTGKKAAEKIIYSFSLGKELCL